MAAVATSSAPYRTMYTSASTSMLNAPTYTSPSPATKAQFAFARIKGGVYLVQVPEPAQGDVSSALVASDVHIFRHEFITQFRFSHSTSLHPADLHILEPIDEQHTLYEEEKGVVFLARDLMARLQKLTLDSQRCFRRPRVAGQVSRSH
ncbi:uncharacterized protein LAESUDRAFT_732052 [Laetiporus sulphureus 93-53]|uniref:Uncharacterized protein n=1 Tax=Laetiporus sulphureus 93-53 TaxID=1314785 RepID=A0A165BAW1_9APHY|nr:uncharacterized protein LAESUDRAFT_732052 [Laetiporus sulphureus 93-53]KZT00639.1 hypothetical protein LAESUDRAFT_732052 [Laetiporus sulphureus 93-53]